GRGLSRRVDSRLPSGQRRNDSRRFDERGRGGHGGGAAGACWARRRHRRFLEVISPASLAVAPTAGHEADRCARQREHGPRQVPLAGCIRLQAREVPEDLLSAARRQPAPIQFCPWIVSERRAEPARHRVHGPAAVAAVEFELHGDAIPDARSGCLSHRFMQVQKEAAVPCGHHIDPPWFSRRFAVDADQYRHRPAPILLQLGGAALTDLHVGIDSQDPDGCRKSKRGLPHEGESVNDRMARVLWYPDRHLNCSSGYRWSPECNSSVCSIRLTSAAWPSRYSFSACRSSTARSPYSARSISSARSTRS